MAASLTGEKVRKTVLSVFFALLSLLWIFPIVLVVLNSFKINTFVKTNTFAIPAG